MKLVQTPASAENARPHRAYRGIALILLSLTIVLLGLLMSMRPADASGAPDFSALVERVSPAVVNIRVTAERSGGATQAIPNLEEMPEFFRRFFENQPPGAQPDAPQGPRGMSQGSGFIVTADGYVLTNAHVVRDATEIEVIMSDRREFVATLVGADARSDVALLKIDADELPTVELGDSEDLKVGQWVLAIGNPFGFEHTATQGIISALSRSLPDENYVPFIQTDVALNPGNSGGPLFNEDGKVIGINSQIYSRTGGYMGLSFAIPINMAMQVQGQLQAQGYVDRGWLGVTIQDLDKGLAESFGLEQPTGALIADVVPDSPADKAGLQRGDVILEYDGKTVTRSGDLPPLVAATTAGADVELDILRAGDEREIRVEIGALQNDDKQLAAAKPAVEKSRLGLVARDLNGSQRKEANIEAGVIVAEVKPNGPAADAGIRRGDIILSFDRTDVNSASELARLVKESPAGEPIAVLIKRQSATQFLALTLPEA